MDVEIVTGGPASGDELRNLRAWLLDEPEFRGRVTLRVTAPRGHELGLDVTALVLAFAGGGGAVLAATTVRTLGNVIVTWMKAHRSPVDVTVRWANGAEVTLTADEVVGLTADGVARLLDDLTARLGSPPDDGSGGSDGAGRSDDAGPAGRAEHPGGAGRAGRSDGAGHAGRAGRSDGAGRAGRSDDAGSAGRAGRSDGTGRAGRAGRAGREGDSASGSSPAG